MNVFLNFKNTCDFITAFIKSYLFEVFMCVVTQANV